jgi:hypothetical protein
VIGTSHLPIRHGVVDQELLERGVPPNIGWLYCIALVYIYRSAPAQPLGGVA